MALNTYLIEKYEKAYEGLKQITQPFTFIPTSPYYHQEEWRVIMPCYVPGILPDTYWISTHGRVYSTLRSPNHPNGGFISPSKNAHEYSQVNLNSTNGRICLKVARLVMLHFAFTPGCHLLEVDHLDGNKDNNCIWNLEWVYPQENTHRAIKNGLRSINCTKYEVIKPIQILLTDEQARELFIKAISSVNTYENLVKEYGVNEDYIKGLVQGSIRPYIRKEYFSKIN